MNFEIIPTTVFVKELKALTKKYPRLKADIKELEKSLKETPTQG